MASINDEVLGEPLENEHNSSRENISTLPDGSFQGEPSKDWSFINVIVLGLAFMLLFTAFQTSSMVEESVIEGAVKESNGTFSGSGYTSLAIIYASFATANWAAPSVVSVCGPRLSMFLGGTVYALFIASFLKPMTWALYTGSVLVGIGAAVIWTAQGNFLTLNSDDNTMGRNSGIFWALFQCSLLIGNIYVYFAFAGTESISDSIRTQLFIVLSSVAVAGVLLFLFLRKPPQIDTSGILNFSSADSPERKSKKGPLEAFMSSLRLMKTRDMLLLSVTFAYTGFELTFFSGVYPTAVGHNEHFGAGAKSLLGLCGIFIGVGEILGGALFGIFGRHTIKYGRDPIVMLGMVVHMVCFYLIFLNLQSDSPMKETSLPTYIPSNYYLAIACAFLLGFGDASFNTQIYSLLGYLYQDDSAPAFAIFKFVQSATAAAGFFYSQHLLLQWQLAILVGLGFLGAWTFCVVEWKTQRPHDDTTRYSQL